MRRLTPGGTSRIRRVAVIVTALACIAIEKGSPRSWAADVPPFRNSEELEDGQWLTPAKDYANTRFSGLKEITAENASQLKLAWSFTTGVERGHEAGPLVVGDTMYVVTPFPNFLYAL